MSVDAYRPAGNSQLRFVGNVGLGYSVGPDHRFGSDFDYANTDDGDRHTNSTGFGSTCGCLWHRVEAKGLHGQVIGCDLGVLINEGSCC